MDIDRYVAQHRPTWNRLAVLTARAAWNPRRLEPDELDELLRLYQRTATHLSVVRTRYADEELTAELSQRVAEANSVLYGTRPRTLRAAGRFFTETFPAAVWHARVFVLWATALFVVPAVAMAIWVGNSSEARNVIAPPAVREAYIAEDFEEYYASEEASQFASSVFTNNVRVGMTAFALGIAGCVGTAYVLILNGANLGVAAGLFADAGREGYFWGLILPHGLLEITAVFVAGGAGLALGWSLISPGDRPRREALAETGRRAAVIVLGLVIVFGVAAIIEGFVTGQPWPTWLRVGIGVLAEALFLIYVAVLGRAAAARGRTGTLGEDRDRGWSASPPPIPVPGRV